jgi:hypothetical protein
MADANIPDLPICNIHEVEHGRMYCISICNVSRDRESGHVYDYDVELVEFNPNDWGLTTPGR